MKVFFLFNWIMDFSEWTPFDSNPIDFFLQGLVGACGVSVLYNLVRVYNFIQTCSDSDINSRGKQRSSSSVNPLRRNWRAALQFWCLTVLLSLVGSRVSSLIVLEFSLRAISAWTSAGLDAGARSVDLLLIQCQFSLGCSLTCTLAFLHQGAPHSSLSLLLAAALSWALAGYSSSLLSHVVRLFPLHSAEHYCGRCISLLTSGHNILASLQRVVVLAFAIATVASTATVYNHFLSQKDAIKFWTPLTLCYAMLVVYSTQEDQTCTESILHTVVVRLGGLLVLMLTVGNWSDVIHVLIAFLGEVVCLLPSQDLLQAVRKEVQETSLRKDNKTFSRNSNRLKTSDDK
ncbi:transmembrane protein 82-like [Melanotaenia boesemani]|uniref:transmembrane protein 82-like n=1 Tax=Melanotaenia boesemani TaxID=1250792 RepID=UPI001C03E00A|nr:transmembrane protein 82-like [Melanotaenia boesemani]